MIIRFSGQVYNQAELQSLVREELTGESIGDLIAALWRRFGTDCVHHFYGDYALVIEDATRGIRFLARSPFGVKPLYYRLWQGQLYTGFTLPELKKVCPAPFVPSDEWMARYLADLSADHRRTAFEDVFKVAHSHAIAIDPAGQIKEWRFHRFVDDAPVVWTRDPRWVEAFRERLFNAIRVRMDFDHPMASENSGGLDSGSITSILAQQLGADSGSRLWSVGFASMEQEPQHILATSRQYKLAHNYIVCGGDPKHHNDAAVLSTIRILGHPIEHSNSKTHRPFYQLCQQHGIKTLFSGFGGDEVATSHAQQVLLEMADQRQFGLLWRHLPQSRRLRVKRVFAALSSGFVTQPTNHLLHHSLMARLTFKPIRSELLEHYGLTAITAQRAVYDAPYRRLNDFILQHHLTESSNVSTRNENCSVIAAHFGVTYRWPLWDVPLVQQYLSTPSIEKLGPNNCTRYLYRRAVDKIAPDMVTWKPTKDMGYAAQVEPQEVQRRIENGLTLLCKLESELHPKLRSMLDFDRVRALSATANTPSERLNLSLSILGSGQAIRQLNLWLNDLA